MSVPVTKSQRSISKFLTHIEEAGIPPKVTNSYLKGAGFTSSNDSALIPVFKSLGFIDSSSSPTERWKQYRNKSESKRVLGQAIKECYSTLFSMYPDADRKDDEAIANWIRSNTTFAGITVTRAVATFKALIAHASFDEVTTKANASTPTETTTTSRPKPSLNTVTHSSNIPSVNINIELQLPATNDPKVYENFFSAMKKHLIDNEGQS